jgi:hypothetical protein
MKLQAELIARLVELGLDHVPYPERDDGFCAIAYGGKELAHFHGFNEIDLRLTKALIRAEGLLHPTDSSVHPKRGGGSDWIELRFTRARQLEQIVRLVMLAAKGR